MTSTTTIMITIMTTNDEVIILVDEFFKCLTTPYFLSFFGLFSFIFLFFWFSKNQICGFYQRPNDVLCLNCISWQINLIGSAASHVKQLRIGWWTGRLVVNGKIQTEEFFRLWNRQKLNMYIYIYKGSCVQLVNLLALLQDCWTFLSMITSALLISFTAATVTVKQTKSFLRSYFFEKWSSFC